MPIEYEMKYLFEVTVDAISLYSEDHTESGWFINIEDTVLRGIVENNPYIVKYFRPYQVTVMRELIHRNLWVRWCEDRGEPILSSDPIQKYRGHDDTKPIPQGAD
jgi:hypothetical protein